MPGRASRSIRSARWSSPRPARRRSTSTARTASATTCSPTRCSRSTRELASASGTSRRCGTISGTAISPPPPTLVTVQRDGHDVDAVAQITKIRIRVSCSIATPASPLFPIEYRKVPRVDRRRRACRRDAALSREPAAVRPADAHRRRCSRRARRRRTPRRSRRFREYTTRGMYDPPNRERHDHLSRRRRRRRVGRAGVRSRRPACSTSTRTRWPWMHKLVPRNDKSTLRLELRELPWRRPEGHADRSRRSSASARAEDARRARRRSSARARAACPASREVLDNGAVERPRELPHHRSRHRGVGGDEPELSEVSQQRAADLPRPRRLSGDHAAVGHAQRDRSQHRARSAGRFRSANIRRSRRRGSRNTGTDNYGGAIVTANGLLFIGATTYDNKFHVFDKLTGKLLWEYTLPAAGNATPSTYVVNGRQYVVIACGGGKNGATSGGTYVAFALPDGDAPGVSPARTATAARAGDAARGRRRETPARAPTPRIR